MASTLTAALAAYIPRDRVESLLRPGSPIAPDGVALIADISGFTALTEALAGELSADRGAEELTRTLDSVFAPLVAAIHRERGSVLKFGGDALIVWFGRAPRARPAGAIAAATAAALRMQEVMRRHGQIDTPIGPVTLRMKIGMAYGPLRRFVLGRREDGYEDAPGGRTLDRMSEAEHHAEPGQIVTDEETLAASGGLLAAERRDGFAVVSGLRRRHRPRPWPPLAAPEDGSLDTDTLLAPFVPLQIAQTLAAGRTQVAELKPVVSMFVQFHGVDYDGDPQVEERLQSYFTTAQRVVARYGGRLNRLITGDKGSLLHIIFGAPSAVEEQEARAVRCALDLQRECGSLPFISMQRIGIARGRVFAGPVGGPERHDYTTMGDAINLSARLMQAAADDQVLVEAGVRSRLGGDVEVAALGEIRVKGKAEPVEVFAATGVRALRREAGGGPAMFGRDAELAELRRHLARLGGQGGAIILTGDVGVGKTLMISALEAAALESAQPPRWLSAIALAYGQALSGYLFVDLLRDLLDLAPGAGAAEAHRRLRELCGAIFGGAALDATYPYLARFMGLPPGEEARRLAGLSGESVRWRIFEVLADLFRRLAARGPLVLALDDLQWADPTTLDLIELLLPLTREVPLVLLLAMRPDREAPSWGLRAQALQAYADRATELALGNLAPEAALAFVARVAPGAPPRIAAQLVERSGGNPLFLSELARALPPSPLADDAAIEALGLPDSVQGLLLAQIDRLQVEARHVLQIASVIGIAFLTRALAAIATGERALDERLRELADREFVRPDDSGEEYRFRHGLVQESAYSTLLYERRRAFHRQVAETLERLFPEQALERAGVLAYHYERAEDFERAAGFHIQAGDSARLLAANAEAEGFYRRALALQDRVGAGDPGQRARLLLKLAQVRSNALDFAGAQDLYDQAFDLLDQVRDSAPPPADGQERSIRLGIFEHGPATLDPGLYEVNDVTEVVRDLFEGLVEVDSELNIIPAAARRWRVEDSGRRYTFELRPGLRWSDGEPLTAADFVFALRRNLDPATASGMAGVLFAVEGAEAFHTGETQDPAAIGARALDDLTLELRLREAGMSFLSLLDHPVTYPQPAHAVRRDGAALFTPERLVGNGAFRIRSWDGGREIVLERSPSYEGFAKGNLDVVRLLFQAPDLAAYQAGRLDLCRVEDQGDVLARYPQEAVLLQYLSTFFLCFDCRRPPFDDPAARRAVAQAVDRDALVAEVWGGVQKAAHGGVVPPGIQGHSPEISWPFDPAEARALWGGGPARPASVRLATLPGSGAMPAYLRAVLERGLGAAVESAADQTVDEVIRGVQAGEVQLAVLACDAMHPDPHYILHEMFHSASQLNFYGWRSPTFDGLVERAARTDDPRERLELYHAADRAIVRDESAIVPLYYYQSFALVRPGYQIEETGRVVRGGTIRLKHIARATSP